MGPKDSLAAAVRRNLNPGPGTHEHISMKTHTFNKVLRQEMEPHYADDKCPPVVDNGVPGPGAYNANDNPPVPNFKICNASPLTKNQKFLQE